MRESKLILFITILLLCLNSCSKVEPARIDPEKSVFWALADGDCGVDAAPFLEYQQLNDFKFHNISNLIGKEGHYIWIKILFNIPEELQDKELGFVVPYIHFAEKVYLNDVFIGQNGGFPPYESSAQYSSHFYSLPEYLLYKDRVNVIYVNIWAKGNSTFSSGAFISEYTYTHRIAEVKDFITSKFYMLFEGSLFITFMIFLMVFIAMKGKDKAYLHFSLICFLTCNFLIYFFGPEIPLFPVLGFKNLFFIKYFLCITIYTILFFISSFMISYCDANERLVIKIIRICILAGSIIWTICIPTFELLRRSSAALLILSIIQVLLGVGNAVYCSLYVPEKRQSARIALKGFIPLITSFAIDYVIRYVFRICTLPFFGIIGWFLSIVFFLFNLIIQYVQMFKRNVLLSQHLERIVAQKTEDLTLINQKLEKELVESSRDLNMASIVQKRFFLPLDRRFDGWELAVCYEPMSSVSGDLYDYYYEGRKLTGLCLFDASGHGMAAGLITMLAKGIISRIYKHSRSGEYETVSTTLEYVNERIIQEKGDIQNYLTGILVRFNEPKKDGSCLAEMANAGHPYPIFYSAKERSIIEVKHDELQEQYGAIGLKNVEVSYPNVDLTICNNDILVLFTDGLTENQNQKMEEFGKERVEQIIIENHNCTAFEIRECIKAGLTTFQKSNPRTDDVSFIVLKRVVQE